MRCGRLRPRELCRPREPAKVTPGLSIFPKTGHTLNLEEPDRFNAELAAFFAQVEAGGEASATPRQRLPGGSANAQARMSGFMGRLRGGAG